MQVWTRAIVESLMQVMNSGLGVFRKLQGYVASAVTQSLALRPMLGFNLCGCYLDIFLFEFVFEVQLDSGAAGTGVLESQLTCGPASQCLPGIGVQLASSMTPGALAFPHLSHPILAPWLQSPTAPEGDLSVSVGRVGGGHVPHCNSGG